MAKALRPWTACDNDAVHDRRGARPASPAGTKAPATAADEDDDTNIIVTATRRSENLQDVPVAITAIGTQTLDQLLVDDFQDYARLVPSLSSNQLAPGFNQVYFRGVASGENANHSASLPSVGTYLDEQPITTITGALDLHIFDIARVEAIAGPPGTPYGASSQAGTIRIITSQPDTNDLYGRVDQRRMNNVPMAIRCWYAGGLRQRAGLVQRRIARRRWYRHDAGSTTFPAPLFPTRRTLPGTSSLPGDDITFNSVRGGGL